MKGCEKCKQLENEITMAHMLLDAIHQIIAGQEVSDFELSFPAVREVADLVASQPPVETDAESREPCYICGGIGIHESYCSRGNNR